MKTSPLKSRPALRVLPSLLAVILVAGCEATTNESTNSLPTTPAPAAETVSPSPSPSVAPASPTPITVPTPGQTPAQATQTAPPQASATIFWLDADAQTVKLVPATVAVPAPSGSKNAASSEAALTGAFEQLLAGPKAEAHSSTIPQGTRLLGIKQVSDGTVVNLSEDFTKGGGTMSMTGRVAQVIYTATALNPGGKVWIEVEGKRLEVLGGEGLVLDQPLTRQKFERDFDL